MCAPVRSVYALCMVIELSLYFVKYVWHAHVRANILRRWRGGQRCGTLYGAVPLAHAVCIFGRAP
eukprot:7017721-Prymnesium_polylepis.2